MPLTLVASSALHTLLSWIAVAVGNSSAGFVSATAPRNALAAGASGYFTPTNLPIAKRPNVRSCWSEHDSLHSADIDREPKPNSATCPSIAGGRLQAGTKVRWDWEMTASLSFLQSMGKSNPKSAEREFRAKGRYTECC